LESKLIIKASGKARQVWEFLRQLIQTLGNMTLGQLVEGR